MQFSESWLRSLCNPALSTDELCHLLTMAGLEVEACEPAAPAFNNVVIAQIKTAEKHPDADKLKLCTVDAGEAELLQIVCGAPNAAVGMKIPCARVGATLPGDFNIKKAKVRGIESFGMLCSARELGLSQEHDGILALPDDAPVGKDFREYLDLDDKKITIKLTPNRADCLSLLGIAREVSALTGAPLNAPASKTIPATISDERKIVLDAPDACPRYLGRIVKGVSAVSPAPTWVKQRLERSGIRSISALVDITNYVMLELGQPLHAFDNDELSGAIHVRYPATGEQLLLLNEQTVTPSGDTALIADDAKPLALAGIMGGEHSGISDSTKDLFLECAFFAPDAIAGKARTLGFSSDASHRYERGVDFDLQRSAIERATELILAICGGPSTHCGPVTEAVAPAHLPTRQPVRLRVARADKVLGISLRREKIEAILKGLGLQVANDGEDFLVTPPSFRFDIRIEEDLIEELARIHGYDNIPSPPPTARMAMMPAGETERSPMSVRRLVSERGYHEVVNFSFVEAAWEADLAANANPITLANPIASQMSVMRSSLIGGLVANLQTNLRRQISRVRVFEIGRGFLRHEGADPVPGFKQPLRLAGLAAGSASPEQWATPARPVDFYDVKADVDALLAPQRASYRPVQHPALHPGRSAEVVVNGEVIGVMGELHPQWVQKYELGKAPVVFELDLAAVQAQAFPAFSEISRFPAVTRDLALVVDRATALQRVIDCLTSAAPAICRSISLFDQYQGKGLAESEKSLAFHIVMQDTQRTLEDAEVDAAIGKILDAATRELAAKLRA
ncbi:MAG: phenylalanine--tRNA ligase subunit beta [Rhodocyclaceae bacterium]|nr:phenylalanine--tRNA ligase subunit beta [Rhodocyclaceae bacterium]